MCSTTTPPNHAPGSGFSKKTSNRRPRSSGSATTAQDSSWDRSSSAVSPSSYSTRYLPVPASYDATWPENHSGGFSNFTFTRVPRSSRVLSLSALEAPPSEGPKPDAAAAVSPPPWSIEMDPLVLAARPPSRLDLPASSSSSSPPVMVAGTEPGPTASTESTASDLPAGESLAFTTALFEGG